MNNNTKNFAFILGREKELAFFELISVLERFCFVSNPLKDDIYRISGNVAFAKLDFSEDRTDEFKEAINRLAGTIKVFRIHDFASQIANVIELIKRSRGNNLKFNFGLSDYSGKYPIDKLNKLGLEIKNKLKKDNFKTRFVASKDSSDLSSILALKNDLVERGIEIGIFGEDIDYRIGELIYLNNPEGWNERDYGKPKGDKFSGMLPPKLARMLVNLTLGEIDNDDVIIVDPFCGSGNVLMEAMMLGCDVIGSDISKKAVSNTKANLEWLVATKKNASKFSIFQADATEYDFKQLAISPKGTPSGQFAIVTEPYLGRPKKYKPTLREVQSEYAGIRKLYIKFLGNIVHQSTINSQPSTVLCLVLPLVETSDNTRFSLYEECVDEIKKMGYTQACKSFIYGRDYQTVKREIIFLKLT